MLPSARIARWVSFGADPISVEDWVANRELFGPAGKPNEQEEELERAYLLEKEREGDKGKGIYGKDGWLLLSMAGKGAKAAFEVEWSGGKEKKRKVKMGCPGFVLVSGNPDDQIKLRVHCQGGFKIGGKRDYSFSDSGKEKIIIEAYVD